MRCARCGSRDIEETPATRMASSWFRCYRCGQAMRPPHRTWFYLLVGIGAPVVGILLAVAVVAMSGTQMPRRVWTLLVMMPIAAFFFGGTCLYKLCYPPPRIDPPGDFLPEDEEEEDARDIPMIRMDDPDDDEPLRPRRRRTERSSVDTGWSFGCLLTGTLVGALLIAVIAGGALIYFLRSPAAGRGPFPRR